MPIRRWTLPLVAVLAHGQETSPLPPEAGGSWRPAWELTLRGDRLSDAGYEPESFRRVDLQLRLRWAWESGNLRLEAGTRSALGSDGNRLNADRWDQQPSNGNQVDVAKATWTELSERAFGSLTLGFQESGLLAPQALWDRNLRFLGAGGRFGLRSPGGLVQEAGFRVAAGRVRDVLGGRVNLLAGQLVLKLDTGPWSWTAHADRWGLAWDAGDERLRALPGHDPALRQRMTVEAVGVSATWHAALPLEVGWSGSRNRETGETAEEAQLALGSRQRVYWPQLALTWQRLSSTGTLYPVNGDEWWYYRGARGPRVDLALPLPDRWLVAVVYLRQRYDGADESIARTLLVLQKRF